MQLPVVGEGEIEMAPAYEAEYELDFEASGWFVKLFGFQERISK